MILDEQLMFSKDQKITQSCVSENVLDLGKREVSFGTPVEVFIQITEAFNNLTNLEIKVQTAMEEGFASAVNLISQTIPVSDLKKGYVSTIKFLPKGNLGYMRLSYTVSGSTPTTGKILAVLTDGTEESFHNI